MKFNRVAAFTLAASMTAFSAFAQDGAKQDMKSAGHDTASATKSAGTGIKKGTKKGYHKTVNGTKKGADVVADKTADGAKATARGTKKVGKAIVGDKTPTTTPR